ncbi:MAG: R3H domain-containing nucleic acid-binding protein [Pyrinomonadaceae bacterium]
MKEAYEQAQNLLNDVFVSAGLDLVVTTNPSEQGCVLNINGDDSPLLRSEGGELLDAVEHLVNQSFIRSLERGERFICDVGDFRAMRETELRAMARHAAERVRSSGVPFTFGAMNANERRVIHLELAEDEGLHTESIGEGNTRRLKVSLKK